jgi:hypothetical protein
MHSRLLKAIEEAIQELTTCEETFYSASKLKVDRKLAEKILAEHIRQFPCEHYFSSIEDMILPGVYIDEVFDLADPYTEEIVREQVGL